MVIQDMPKLQSPFVRKNIDGNFIVTPEIDPDYRWVFEDKGVTCQEKLDGASTSIVIEDGQIKHIFNRNNRVGFFDNNPIVDAVRNSSFKGYCNFTDGQYFGESIGTDIQGNKYKLDKPLWLPFNTYFKEHLAYRTWGKYPKDYETRSNWMKDGLLSLFGMVYHNGDKTYPCEGIVFHHPDGRMAKLRRDMFDWFTGARHKEILSNLK